MTGPISVVVQTTGPVVGGAAIPVEVVDGPPVAGAAQPVYVVTSGPVVGGDPQPVALASGGPVVGGAAIPVYVVSGSLSGAAPAPDPPLDALFGDLFTGGGVATPRTATPGPGTSTITNTTTQITLNANTDTLSLDGPAPNNGGWQKIGIVDSTGRTRADGLVAVFRLQHGDVQAQASDLTNQNLAVGWFSGTNPTNPETDGSALIFYNNGTSGGAIVRNGSAEVGNQMTLIDNVAISSVKQVEFILIIALWASGARYYVASLDNVRQLPATGYPSNMRLVHVASLNRTTTPVYAGIFQRHTLGGATQIKAMAVLNVAAWQSAWYATAYVADQFGASGTVSGTRAAQIGGTWTVVNTFDLTADGLAPQNIATCRLRMWTGVGGTSPSVPPGVFACTVVTEASIPDYAIFFTWRASGGSNYFFLRWSATTAILAENAGAGEVTRESFPDGLPVSSTVKIVIIDDGATIQAWRDGRRVINYASTAGASNTGIEIGLTRGGSGQRVSMQDVEIHPRSVTVPSEITSLGLGSIWATQGSSIVTADTFAGASGNLTGHTTTTGAQAWTKRSGANILLSGSGTAAVNGAAGGVNTLYTTPHATASFADVSVEVTGPADAWSGSGSGKAGPLIYGDANNWIYARTYLANDQINSAEIEIYYNWRGEVSTVLRRVNFGTEFEPGDTVTVRLTSDGDHFACWLGSEPIHTWRIAYSHPAHTAWSITAVGLGASSDDTGSVFDNFTVRV